MAKPSMKLGPSDAFPATVKIKPVHRFLASFRPAAPVKIPKVPPFDLDALSETFASLQGPIQFHWIDFRKAKLSVAMDDRSADWWLRLITDGIDYLPAADGMREMADRIGLQSTGGSELTTQTVVDRISKLPFAVTPLIAVPLVVQFGVVGAMEVVDACIAERHGDHRFANHARNILSGMRAAVRPYLLEDETDVLRTLVQERLPSISYLEACPIEEMFTERLGLLLLAAQLGPCDAVAATVRGIPDDYYREHPGYTTNSDRPDLLLGGLSNADEFVEQWHRIGPRYDWSQTPGLVDPEPFGEVAIVALGFDAADLLAEQIRLQTTKVGATRGLKLVNRIVSPWAAAALLPCQLQSKATGDVGQWFDQHVDEAVEGLMPIAGGADPPGQAANRHDYQRRQLADKAVDYFVGLVAQGQAARVRQAVADARERAATRPEAEAAPLLAAADRIEQDVLASQVLAQPMLDEATTPAWLAEALAAG